MRSKNPRHPTIDTDKPGSLANARALLNAILEEQITIEEIEQCFADIDSYPEGSPVAEAAYSRIGMILDPELWRTKLN